jgi:hypothetical protein
MIFTERVLILMTSVSALTAYAVTNETVSEDRNYQVIVERNPFGLKPPPTPPTNAPAVTQPKDEIFLTGITSIGGPRAYFMTKAPQGKQPEFFSLSPGLDQARNGLEVLAIDLNTRSVRVRSSGSESVMTFAANGIKPPATPTTGQPPPMPGAAMPPGVNLPGAGFNPGAGGIHPGGAQPGAVAGAVTAGSPATSTGRIRTIPSRNMRTPPALPTGEPNPAAAQPNPDAAVQDVLMMELQKRTTPGVPFPPTPMPQ